MKKTTYQFKKEVNDVHNNKYKYPDEYVNAHTKLKIVCPTHGLFYQKPNNHLSGQGCPKCAGKITLTNKEFILKANDIYDNKYKYPEKYINNKTYIKIICSLHGEFKKRPDVHLYQKQGCPFCTKIKSSFKTITKSNYSKVAISWLNEIAEYENIHIQHAENEGEYYIPNTRYKADGFCKKTNTIYEFYGDVFHGNLRLFNEDEQCHPFINECAGNLYMKTINREQKIEDLGYNLVTIWEHDYVKNKI